MKDLFGTEITEAEYLQMDELPHCQLVNFNEFWSYYPKRIGKKTAYKKYKLAIESGVLHDEIMNGVRAYVTDLRVNGTSRQFIASPITWLNQGRWDDEYEGGDDWGDVN